MRFATCLCLTLAVPCTAGAVECVGTKDMGQGIRVEYEDGHLSDFRRLADGTIEKTEIGTAAGGGDLRFTSQFGIFDLKAQAVIKGATSPNHQVVYSYGGDALRTPEPGGLPWVGPVQAIFPGGEKRDQKAAYLFGGETMVELDGCSYRGFPISVIYTRDPGWEGQDFLYFADLGIAALVARSGIDGRHDTFPIKRLAALGG